MNYVVKSVVKSRSRKRSVYRISGATATVMSSRYPPFAAPRHPATAFAAMASAAALASRASASDGSLIRAYASAARTAPSSIRLDGFGPSDPNAAAAAAAAADRGRHVAHTPSDASTTHRGASTPCVPGWRMSVTVISGVGVTPRARQPRVPERPRHGDQAASRRRLEPHAVRPREPKEAVARALDAPHARALDPRALVGAIRLVVRGQVKKLDSALVLQSGRPETAPGGAPQSTARLSPTLAVSNVSPRLTTTTHVHPDSSCSTLPLGAARSAASASANAATTASSSASSAISEFEDATTEDAKYRSRDALIFAATNFETRRPSAPWPSKTPNAKSPAFFRLFFASPPGTMKKESWFSFATPFTPPARVAVPAQRDAEYILVGAASRRRATAETVGDGSFAKEAPAIRVEPEARRARDPPDPPDPPLNPPRRFSNDDFDDDDANEAAARSRDARVADALGFFETLFFETESSREMVSSAAPSARSAASSGDTDSVLRVPIAS